MIAARVALHVALSLVLAGALLFAHGNARAQPADASDVAPPLRPAVTAYRAGDLPTAEQALRKLVAEDADAEAWLGAVLLDRGNNREGLQALQHAVDRGSSEGAQRLALVFAEGLAGTPRNDAKAVALFQKAAEAGNRRAQLDLGVLYLRGQGVTRDLLQARAWLEKAASDDNPYALYTLGRALEETEGAAAADPTRAADLYRRAAEKGHPLAALRYGLALTEGTGIKRDDDTAQRWLIAAQQAGVPEAALAMGDMAARRAVRDRAGREKLVQTAATWYRTAADAGVASAQYKLASAYFAGAGVDRDMVQAQIWYSRAAQQGLPDAQQALGLLLIGGKAGAADPVEGYKWLLLAERGGFPDAKEIREKMAKQVSDADRKKGEALAKAFAPVVERPMDTAPPPLKPMPRP
ncbi:MAG TPA: tetratricopeptide repeat protein [Reyranella sp.]|nr:tetratricopeptide repeat protein [Reyranella sp.]